MKNYEVIIIGGGPAGLTAAIYTARRALKTLVLSKDIGGQTALTNEIENYPGFDQMINGFELAHKLKTQAEKFGAEIILQGVESVVKDGDEFVVNTNNEQFTAPAVILAFGVTPRNLEIPGEKELTGRGVSYCVNCDGPFYKNKTTAVVGGGNSALDAADFLTKICRKVYLIHHRDKFRGEEITLKKLTEKTNLTMLLNYRVTKITGADKIKSITITDVNRPPNTQELTVDGLFIEIGKITKSDWIRHLVALDDKNQIIVNNSGETKTPGLFAAGDATNVQYKQIVIAAGEGAKAALTAYSYLSQINNQIKIPDWGIKK